MLDKVGQQIGNYRLAQRLGSGGFAEVYLGQHVHLASKQAAIKILHVPDVNREAFQREAETTASLEHAHIVRLLDYAFEQGMPFLVLDFAPGGSLRTRHPKGSEVAIPQVVDYLRQIAPALQYAHDRRVLHRDIKPENILIGRHGELVLSDFGIAVLSQSTRHSQLSSQGVGGTPYYMAPEMYRGKPEKASDQYALAVVVYEWLCGSVPFSEGEHLLQIAFQVAYEPPPPLREKNPAIPPQVEAVVMRALSKDPQQRFGSVSAFATAFEQAAFSARQSVSQVAPPPPVSTSSWGRTPVMDAGASQMEQRMMPVRPASPQNTPLAPLVQAPGRYVPPSPSVPQGYPASSQPGTAEWATHLHAQKARQSIFGAVGSGAVGGVLAMVIAVAHLNAVGSAPSSDWVINEGVNNTVLGAVMGAVAVGIALAVVRLFAGKAALQVAGSLEVIVVGLVGMLAGALGVGVSLYFGPALAQAFTVLALVAVLAGVIAGAVVAGRVRTKSSRLDKRV